ncbi:ABC transporter substrate-binding protein [Pseudoduganella namucuonensis]|nr:ABC transporter substrate-binding protein [Pseudoduganella namucuonensis]
MMLVACPLLSTAAGGEVEVLHFWTSGGEAGAVAKLKATLRNDGHTWKDFVIAGGGGGQAMVLLKSRVLSGNPPTAAQIKGASIPEWARTGTLSSIEGVAAAEKWDRLLPKIVSDTMKHKGVYVAAPLNVHRVNWLWVNASALRKANARFPATWEEFFAVADAMKKAGIAPIAYGGQSWLDLGAFESVALGVGGPDFYRKAFMELDPSALNSPQMEKTLETYRRIKSYIGRNAVGGDWVRGTSMLIKGEAGMQLMGDWAKAEIQAAGMKPGIDVLCGATPGSANAFTFNIDSFAMFQVSGENRAAQNDLARAVMSKDFQETFNLAKGSIPVRMDVKMDKFDECAQRSSQDFSKSAKRGALLPSLAHGMAQPSQTVAAIWDVISQFWNQDRMTAAEAMAKLTQAAKAHAAAPPK